LQVEALHCGTVIVDPELRTLLRAGVFGVESVLLIHGDDDRNVPFQQITDLVEKLRAQNVAFEELIIPDEIHDLLRWSDWVRSYKATADFFDRKLAATPQP